MTLINVYIIMSAKISYRNTYCGTFFQHFLTQCILLCKIFEMWFVQIPIKTNINVPSVYSFLLKILSLFPSTIVHQQHILTEVVSTKYCACTCNKKTLSPSNSKLALCTQKVLCTLQLLYPGHALYQTYFLCKSTLHKTQILF